MKLVIELGGQCVNCGSTENLEIDHKKPRQWRLEAVEMGRRVSRYVREAREGLVQVLCSECNKLKGDREDREERLSNGN